MTDSAEPITEGWRLWDALVAADGVASELRAIARRGTDIALEGALNIGNLYPARLSFYAMRRVALKRERARRRGVVLG